MASESQYVTFGLGAEVFAAPVAQVREILDYRPAFRIPNGPPYLLGLTDVRGQGVPTIDLRLRLGLAGVEPTPHTRVLVVDLPLSDRTLSLGLVADRVFEVTPVRCDEVEAAPDVGVPWNSEYIGGVVRRNGGFLVLLDLPRIFSDPESVTGSATVDHAA